MLLIHPLHQRDLFVIGVKRNYDSNGLCFQASKNYKCVLAFACTVEAGGADPSEEIGNDGLWRNRNLEA